MPLSPGVFAEAVGAILERNVALERMQAMRTMAGSVDHKILAEALHDPSPDVRSYAVRWIADERMMDLRDDVAKLLEGPQPSSQYYLAVVGAVDWLDHEPTMHGVGIADALLMLELESDRRTPEAHALALTMMTPLPIQSPGVQGWLLAKENARLLMEREILKKATAFFAKHQS